MNRAGRVVSVCLLLLLASPLGAGQDVNPGPPHSAAALLKGPQFGQRREPNEDVQRIEREQAKRANKERHESLKRDTDKLLELTTELKRYVDRSNENLLSLEVIKKAEEIEKLAKRVRDKMKD